MNRDNIPSFQEFLTYFPEIELPVNISSEYLNIFSNYNKPIPEDFIHTYIISSENSVDLENVIEDEYITCFKIPGTMNFHALVYIKISMLNYDYYLHSFDMAGNSIDSKVIASMHSDGTNIIEKAALIDENHMIWTMRADETEDFDPAMSKFSGFQLLNNGKVISV